jgi:hypothetical protein
MFLFLLDDLLRLELESMSMLCLKGCLYSDCYYTEKSNLLGNNSLELFDAILFAVPSFRHEKQAESIIPKRRSPNQRYVMVRIFRYALAEVSCFYGQNSDYLYS